MEPTSPTCSRKRPSELNIKGNHNQNRDNEILFPLHNIIEIGYCMARGTSPNHVSSLNPVDSPHPRTNLDLLKRATFVFIYPFQKGESFHFFITCARVLVRKYLLRNNWIHIPSSSIESL